MIVAPSLDLSRTPSTSLRTLVDLLERRAALQPCDLAYCFLLNGEDDEVLITYSELQERAKKISLALRDVAKPGDRALLIYESGLDFIAAFFGCLYAGVIAVPVSLPSKRSKFEWIQKILHDAHPRVILSSEAIRSELLDATDSASQFRDVLLLTEADSLLHDPRAWIAPRITSASIAFLQYTSGSTHTPKGVIVSHGNILANEFLIQSAFRHGSQTIGLGWLPHYHDMGLIGNILQTLYIGRPCLLMSPFHFVQKPFRWLRAISKYKATSSGGPNFAYEMCINRITEDQKRQLDLSSWQVAFTGAEIIRVDTLRKFGESFASCGFNTKAFYPCYGLAESTLFVTGRRDSRDFGTRRLDSAHLSSHRIVDATAESDAAVTLVGCGQAWPGHEVKIVDPESLHPCPAGRVGEIWVQGPSVTKGYWRRPEEHKITFAARLLPSGEGPYLRTGDLGFFADGELFIAGRLKDLIIIRGHNYYPHEIEATVQASTEGLLIDAGAAFSIEWQGQEKLVIVQEVSRSHLREIQLQLTIDRVRTSVLRSHDLRVHAIVLTRPATIPKTSSGKIKRSLCRQLYQEDQFQALLHWVEGKA